MRKKKNQSEMNNTITEIKKRKTSKGTISRLGTTEEYRNNLGGRKLEITQLEQQKEKLKNKNIKLLNC